MNQTPKQTVKNEQPEKTVTVLKTLKVSMSVKIGEKEETFFSAPNYKIELLGENGPRIQITSLRDRKNSEAFTSLHNAIYWT